MNYRTGVTGQNRDVRSMMLSMGVPSGLVGIAMSQAFLIPRITDPDAQSTIILIEGAQRGFQRLGLNVDVNGDLDQATVAAMLRVSGASWHAKTWLQIYGDILNILKSGKKFGHPLKMRALGDDEAPGGAAAGFVAILFVGGFLAYTAFGKKRSKA